MSRYIYNEIDSNQISNEEAFAYTGTNYQFDVFEMKCHLDDYLRFFSKKDLDIIYLSFLSGKRQNDVSAILTKTQPAISYDINRINKQLEFVIYMMSKIDDLLNFISTNNILSTEENDILLILFFSTSFTKTAKVLKQHQITCRTKFAKIMNKLKVNDDYEEIYDLFQQIENNLNKVKKTIYKK